MVESRVGNRLRPPGLTESIEHYSFAGLACRRKTAAIESFGAATSGGVLPSLFVAFTSAPSRTRYRTTDGAFPAAASCSGVLPSLSFVSIFAPSPTRYFATATDPTSLTDPSEATTNTPPR